MEELIIHTVAINRIGELKHFEIPLSKNANKIYALWYKIRLLDDATRGAIVIDLKGRSTYNPEVIVGQISLSSNQREGVFYFSNLILDNANLGMLDFTGGVFAVNNYTHASSDVNLNVTVDAETSTVHGYILDNWGVISGRNVRYEVDIYLYQKLNVPLEDKNEKP